MTNIAVLGSGRVAVALADSLARAGHQLVIGSRNSDETRLRWQGAVVTVTELAAAIEASDVVFNATPGDSSLERLSALSAELAGKLLVDVANAVARDDAGAPQGLLYPSDSLGERLQAALPATHVVKALNTMLAPVMGNPQGLAVAPTVFLSGDDQGAKSLVRSLLADIGWSDDWVLDLGGIQTARGPEAVMLMVPDIVRATGFQPFAVSIAR